MFIPLGIIINFLQKKIQCAKFDFNKYRQINEDDVCQTWPLETVKKKGEDKLILMIIYDYNDLDQH